MRWPWISRKRHEAEIMKLTGIAVESKSSLLHFTSSLQRECVTLESELRNALKFIQWVCKHNNHDIPQAEDYETGENVVAEFECDDGTEGEVVFYCRNVNTEYGPKRFLIPIGGAFSDTALEGIAENE